MAGSLSNGAEPNALRRHHDRRRAQRAGDCLPTSPGPVCKVLVLERRHVVGGACVTEEVLPGFKVSTAAYVNSLFRPEIIRELELKKYGFEMLPRNPSSFTPFPDGRYLMMGPDAEMTQRGDRASSARAMPRRIRNTRRCSSAWPTSSSRRSTRRRPTRFGRGSATSGTLVKLGRRPSASSATRPARRWRSSPGRRAPILDRWFESEQLKATLATDAIIGALARPVDAGDGLRALPPRHGRVRRRPRRLGHTSGAAWAGSRRRSPRAARGLGAEIRCEAAVARDPRARRPGRRASCSTDGDEIHAPIVACNADANVTFRKLLDPKDAAGGVRRTAIERIDYSSASLKINVALAELPNFSALPGTEPGRHRFDPCPAHRE